MREVYLKEIAKACGAELRCENAPITSVCTDSRKVTEGCLFVALGGENFDGNNFAAAATEKGAVAAVCSREAGCGDKTLLVGDTLKALSDIAAWYRREFKIPVVGLTGSVGKTTTKEMVHCVVSAGYNTLKNVGNLNNQIGMPMTVFGLDESYEAAVLEMGMADFGEIANLSRVAAPTIGILTNIGVSHMETLGSRENIRKAKLELLGGMEEAAPVIVNADDDMLSVADFGKHPVIWYGIESEKCDIRAEDIEIEGEKTIFTAIYKGKKQRVNLPAVGIHNVYNALAALAAGDLLGIDIEKGAAALENYEPSGMRQRVRKVEGVTVIEDCYNASPDSVRASLSALAAIPCEGRRIAVLGDMLELGSVSEEGHYNTGKIAAETGADMLFTFGERSAMTAKAAKENGLPEVKSFTDASLLTKELQSRIKPSDCVLFKASRGMKLEEIINALYEGWKTK